MNAWKPIQMPMPCATKRGEMALALRRLPRDGEGARDDPGEERDHHRHAGEAELLGEHREQEVGVRLGQVVQLLDARAQADAEPFAAAEGDQRVRELVAACRTDRTRDP